MPNTEATRNTIKMHRSLNSDAVKAVVMALGKILPVSAADDPQSTNYGWSYDRWASPAINKATGLPNENLCVRKASIATYKVSQSDGANRHILRLCQLHTSDLRDSQNEILYDFSVFYHRPSNDDGSDFCTIFQYIRASAQRTPVYLQMKYHGRTQQERVASRAYLFDKHLGKYMLKAMQTLHVLHSLGCVHRELMHYNLLMSTDSDDVCIIDFSSAYCIHDYVFNDEYITQNAANANNNNDQFYNDAIMIALFPTELQHEAVTIAGGIKSVQYEKIVNNLTIYPPVAHITQTNLDPNQVVPQTLSLPLLMRADMWQLGMLFLFHLMEFYIIRDVANAQNNPNTPYGQIFHNYPEETDDLAIEANLISLGYDLPAVSFLSCFEPNFRNTLCNIALNSGQFTAEGVGDIASFIRSSGHLQNRADLRGLIRKKTIAATRVQKIARIETEFLLLALLDESPPQIPLQNARLFADVKSPFYKGLMLAFSIFHEASDDYKQALIKSDKSWIYSVDAVLARQIIGQAEDVNQQAGVMFETGKIDVGDNFAAIRNYVQIIPDVENNLQLSTADKIRRLSADLAAAGVGGEVQLQVQQPGSQGNEFDLLNMFVDTALVTDVNMGTDFRVGYDDFFSADGRHGKKSAASAKKKGASDSRGETAERDEMWLQLERNLEEALKGTEYAGLSTGEIYQKVMEEKRAKKSSDPKSADKKWVKLERKLQKALVNTEFGGLSTHEIYEKIVEAEKQQEQQQETSDMWLTVPRPRTATMEEVLTEEEEAPKVTALFGIKVKMFDKQMLTLERVFHKYMEQFPEYKGKSTQEMYLLMRDKEVAAGRNPFDMDKTRAFFADRARLKAQERPKHDFRSRLALREATLGASVASAAASKSLHVPKFAASATETDLESERNRTPLPFASDRKQLNPPPYKSMTPQPELTSGKVPLNRKLTTGERKQLNPPPYKSMTPQPELTSGKVPLNRKLAAGERKQLDPPPYASMKPEKPTNVVPLSRKMSTGGKATKHRTGVCNELISVMGEYRRSVSEAEYLGLVEEVEQYLIDNPDVYSTPEGQKEFEDMLIARLRGLMDEREDLPTTEGSSSRDPSATPSFGTFLRELDRDINGLEPEFFLAVRVDDRAMINENRTHTRFPDIIDMHSISKSLSGFVIQVLSAPLKFVIDGVHLLDHELASLAERVSVVALLQPLFEGAMAKTTIRRLLQHVSGVPLNEALLMQDGIVSLEEVAVELTRMKNTNDAGEGVYEYNSALFQVGTIIFEHICMLLDLLPAGATIGKSFDTMFKLDNNSVPGFDELVIGDRLRFTLTATGFHARPYDIYSLINGMLSKAVHRAVLEDILNNENAAKSTNPRYSHYCMGWHLRRQEGRMYAMGVNGESVCVVPEKMTLAVFIPVEVNEEQLMYVDAGRGFLKSVFDHI